MNVTQLAERFWEQVSLPKTNCERESHVYATSTRRRIPQSVASLTESTADSHRIE